MINEDAIERLFKKKLDEAYDIWDGVNGKKGDIDKAIIELQKLFLQMHDKLKKIENRRLLLNGLVVAELLTKKPEHLQSAKLHSKLLLDELNSIPNYKKENKHKYSKALNNYIDSYKDELSNEEKIKAYEEYYDAFKTCTPNDTMGYFNKLTAKFNISLLERNDNIVLQIMDILLHNNNKQYQDQFECFEKEIKKTDVALYKNVLLLKEEEKRNNKVS